MAWRHLAAGAAGVVAAGGFGAHGAAADEPGSAEASPDATPPAGDPILTTAQADKLAEAAALNEIANALPKTPRKPRATTNGATQTAPDAVPAFFAPPANGAPTP